jgi:hypothetical protein
MVNFNHDFPFFLGAGEDLRVTDLRSSLSFLKCIIPALQTILASILAAQVVN